MYLIDRPDDGPVESLPMDSSTFLGSPEIPFANPVDVQPPTQLRSEAQGSY